MQPFLLLGKEVGLLHCPRLGRAHRLPTLRTQCNQCPGVLPRLVVKRLGHAVVLAVLHLSRRVLHNAGSKGKSSDTFCFGSLNPTIRHLEYGPYIPIDRYKHRYLSRRSQAKCSLLSMSSYGKEYQHLLYTNMYVNKRKIENRKFSIVQLWATMFF